jgi:hypothetical protein
MSLKMTLYAVPVLLVVIAVVGFFLANRKKKQQ